MAKYYSCYFAIRLTLMQTDKNMLSDNGTVHGPAVIRMHIFISVYTTENPFSSTISDSCMLKLENEKKNNNKNIQT